MTCLETPAVIQPIVTPLVPLTPPHKWLGSKRQLATRISEYIPNFTGRWIEAFAGSAALFYYTHPASAILADVNPNVVAFMQVLRDKPEELIELLQSYPTTNRDFYIALRQTTIDGMSDVEIAARFKYLVSTSFNGLWRENRKGQMNADWGKYEKPNICDTEHLLNCSRTLQNAEIICADFRHTLSLAQPGDCVYCDSPYVALSDTANFTRYSKNGFSGRDHCDLAESIYNLVFKGVTVLASNSDVPLVRELYGWAEFIPVDALRSVSCKGDTRGRVREWLIRSK